MLKVHIEAALTSSSIVADQVHVDADKAVHVGDDKIADKVGANAVGIDCW